MSERKTFIRKLIYGAMIVLLWIPLSRMSQPATKTSPGGTLASLRKDLKLSQAELGDIDPTSATMKLATMGLGGIAVNLLWDRANEYKKKEDWIALGATLEQIVKLQPNFYKVWDFQAHNLSYNISAEFDDVRDKYTYVIRGIHFLKQGFEKNENEPRLLNRIGWYIGQKIGRADEHKIFRQLFSQDWNDLFHRLDNPDRTPEERDNWLVSKEYFRNSENLADRLESQGTHLKTSPVLFFSEAPKSQINYAETRQLEGRFLEDLERRETKRAWEIARGDWHDRRSDPISYGRRLLPTSFGPNIRLEDLESQQALVADLSQKLEAMLPGVRERLREQKLSKLPADAREAVRTPRDQRTNDQNELASQHEHTVAVPWDEVADEAPEDTRADAKSLANALLRAELQVMAISTERMKVNYEYWRTRGLAESEDETIKARQLTYEANKLVNDVEIFKAVPLYEEAWKIWRRVIDRHPRMAGESVSADELMEDINRYKDILAKQGQKVPQPFILQDVIDVAEGRVTFTPEDIATRELRAREKSTTQTNESKTDEAQNNEVKQDQVKTTQEKETAANVDDLAKDKATSNGNSKKVNEKTDGAEK